MAVSPTQIEQVITDRLSGDGVRRFTVGGDLFEGEKALDLHELQTRVERRVPLITLPSNASTPRDSAAPSEIDDGRWVLGPRARALGY